MNTLLKKFQTFLKQDSATGILLVIATLAALLIANSPLHEYYHKIMELKFTIGFPKFKLQFSLHHWINDGLMALFFLLVGLEIKSELKFGRLQSFQSAVFPTVAAIFGALLPAVIFYILNSGTPYQNGWAIPMATDIAFVIGIIAILGSRIPSWAKVFVTTIAVVDDLIAVLVIAFFYTDNISWHALALAAVCVVVLIYFNYKNTNKLTPYLVVGFVLWAAVLASGVHATIAGVILAFTIPLHREWSIEQIKAYAKSGLEEFKIIKDQNVHEAHYFLEEGIREIESPLKRLERKLHGPVYHFIMPLFAFVNAGILFKPEIIEQVFHLPITWGILAGVLLGKPLGILLAMWILVTFFYKNMPKTKALWRVILGIGLLCGIGFTMSLFITNLSFTDAMVIEEAKIAILLASLIAGVLGYVLLYKATKNQEDIQLEEN